MPIYTLGADTPTITPGAGFIAPDAILIGRVTVLVGASIWFGAVLRGDNDDIIIGEGSNIQDQAMIHTDPGLVVTLGRNVTVGHKALLHGCSVDNNTLIGMGAIVLNRAKIGRNCIIGAGALVTEGTEIPDNSLVMGMPARVVKQRDPEAARQLNNLANRYVSNSERYRSTLTLVSDNSSRDD